MVRPAGGLGMADPRHLIDFTKLFLLCCTLLVAQPLFAQEQQVRPVRLQVMISHLSQEPGKIDARAQRLDRILRPNFRYRSLKVIESRRFSLRYHEVGSLRLPTGRRVRVRPLSIDKRGVLMAVDVEGTLKTDLRVRNRHPVVIGAQRYRDGKLVITLEPDL